VVGGGAVVGFGYKEAGNPNPRTPAESAGC